MEDIITPFWNRRGLMPPTIRSLEIPCSSPEAMSSNLADILENILSRLLDLNLLHPDAALVTRMLFRTKRHLRCFKGYKCIQKVRQSLQRYLELDLTSTMTEIRQTAYGRLGPSRQVLEWGLVGLQRFAALFYRLLETCSEAAVHMLFFIRSGHYWELAILYLAYLGRIWTLSRFFVSRACEWYSQLFQFHGRLGSSDEPWLPSGYTLPSDLKSWLGASQSWDKLDAMVDSVNVKSAVDHPQPKTKLSFNEDFGEIIHRSKHIQSVEALKGNNIVLENIEDIFAFIQKEQKLRVGKNDKCKVLKLTDSEWNSLKSQLKKTYMELTSTQNESVIQQTLKKTQMKIHKWINK